MNSPCTSTDMNIPFVLPSASYFYWVHDSQRNDYHNEIASDFSILNNSIMIGLNVVVESSLSSSLIYFK